MFRYAAVLFTVMVSTQSVYGGLLHGDAYSGIAAPAEYAYASSSPYVKLGAHTSPLISGLSTSYAAAPLATYAGRYAAHSGYATAYNAAPLTATYAAAVPIAKYTTSLTAAPLAHTSYAATPLTHAAYAASPLQDYTSYSSPLIRHGSYAAAPIASYGGSIGSYESPLSVQGSYDGGYAYPLAGHAAYGSLGHGAELSAW